MNARTLAVTLTSTVNTLLVARVVAATLREKIDTLNTRILAERAYTKATGDRVTDPKSAWLLGDADFESYHARCGEEIILAGYDVPEGVCPALAAEHTVTEAEWALIEAARADKDLAHMSNNRLLCGTKDRGGLETRARYIDLLIGMVVNSPNYRGTGDSLLAAVA